MTKPQIDDVRIEHIQHLQTPEELLAELPVPDATAEQIVTTRKAIEHVIYGGSDRLLVIAGPCSIHDPAAAREYGTRLVDCATRYAKQLLIIMRVYFEKPRTTIGWKGLINDPDLDGSYNIDKGLYTARSLLLDLNRMGLPCGCEFLDIISPQYIADLVAWGAIGARTTESQVHRELASALSCPVGFKNGTEGNIKIAADAIRSANQKHHFLSVTKAGRVAISRTRGNKTGHLILRGGSGGPNYSAEHVDAATATLAQSGLPGRLVVDCSHANSGKDHTRQPHVAADVAAQIAAGDMRIIGVMLESNLVAGNQEIIQGEQLTYGQSVTDACMDWETTEGVLEELAQAVRTRQRNLRLQE